MSSFLVDSAQNMVYEISAEKKLTALMRTLKKQASSLLGKIAAFAHQLTGTLNPNLEVALVKAHQERRKTYATARTAHSV